MHMKFENRFGIEDKSIFDKKRNEPVDKSRWFINPDAFVLTGKKKYRLEFIEVMSVIKFLITNKTGVPWANMVTKTRKREIVFSRQLFHYFSRKYTNASLSAIGAHGGGKDHSTVLHSCRVVENLIETDKRIRLIVHDIKESIKSRLALTTPFPDEEKEEEHDRIADWEKVKHKYINQ